MNKTIFTPPFRLGKTNKHVILDSNDLEVMVFRDKALGEQQALEILKHLNSVTIESSNLIDSLYEEALLKNNGNITPNLIKRLMDQYGKYIARNVRHKAAEICLNYDESNEIMRINYDDIKNRK